MILTQTLMFDLDRGRYSILAYEDHQFWIMEREWKFNRRNVSCVPRDEYTLERHSSPKYPDTWAVIGDGVAHYASENKPRFACVVHQAVFPTDLEGCLAPALSIGAAGEALGSREAMDKLRLLLDREENHKILMQ